MVVAGFVGIVFAFLRRIPGLTLDLSTTVLLMRDSPHIKLPDIAQTAELSERSRLRKDVKVRVGDVSPKKDVGQIAMGSAAAVYGFRPGRVYA